MIIIFKVMVHCGDADGFHTALIERRAVGRAERYADFLHGNSKFRTGVEEQVDCVRIGRHGIVKIVDVDAQKLCVADSVDCENQRFDVVKFLCVRFRKRLCAAKPRFFTARDKHADLGIFKVYVLIFQCL